MNKFAAAPALVAGRGEYRALQVERGEEMGDQRNSGCIGVILYTVRYYWQCFQAALEGNHMDRTLQSSRK